MQFPGTAFSGCKISIVISDFLRCVYIQETLSHCCKRACLNMDFQNLACICNSDSAGISNAASTSNASSVFTCLFPFSTSLSNVYEIPISVASCFWEIPLYSSSSFSTSPECVGRKGSRLFAIIFGSIHSIFFKFYPVPVIDSDRGQSFLISF